MSEDPIKTTALAGVDTEWDQSPRIVAGLKINSIFAAITGKLIVDFFYMGTCQVFAPPSDFQCLGDVKTLRASVNLAALSIQTAGGQVCIPNNILVAGVIEGRIVTFSFAKRHQTKLGVANVV